MNSVVDVKYQGTFQPEDLVTWHEQGRVPVAGVVVRLEPDKVVIKARIEGAFKEVQVHPEELATR